MGHKNGKITAPVSIYDVQQTLGDSSTDLGTLCRSQKINPYAKYKPVKWSNVDVDLHEGNNWKGEDGLCGFNIPVYMYLSDLLYDMKNGITITYNPFQSGGFYRLLDFNGYNHNAPNGFFSDPNLQGDTYVENGKVNLRVGIDYDPYHENVSFLDLSPYRYGVQVNASEMYLCVYFYRSVSEYFYVVDENKFSEFDGYVDLIIPISEAKMNKSWTYLVFLCEDRNLGYNKELGMYYETLFLPTNINPINVKFLSYTNFLFLHVYIIDIEGTIGRFNFRLHNGRSESVKFTNFVATLYNYNTGQELKSIIIHDALTLNGGKSYSFDFDFEYGQYFTDIEESYEIEVAAIIDREKLYGSNFFDTYIDGTWNEC